MLESIGTSAVAGDAQVGVGIENRFDAMDERVERLGCIILARPKGIADLLLRKLACGRLQEELDKASLHGGEEADERITIRLLSGGHGRSGDNGRAQAADGIEQVEERQQQKDGSEPLSFDKTGSVDNIIMQNDLKEEDRKKEE